MCKNLNAYHTHRLELAFEDKSIRTTCENEDSAKEQYGLEISAKLKARLADFRAAKRVSELIVGNPREFTFKPHPIYKVDLCNGYNISFCSNHSEIPVSDSGEVLWSKVSRIKILKVDNHE